VRKALQLLLIYVNIAYLYTRLMETRNCQECGQKLSGRKDQKFCSDYCRNTFNNRLNEDSTNTMRRINNILRKNRRILATLNPVGKKTVDALTLAEEGFNFHYFTNIYTTQKGIVYFFCYDQWYTKMELSLIHI
jgi:hypothetical protein